MAFFLPGEAGACASLPGARSVVVDAKVVVRVGVADGLPSASAARGEGFSDSTSFPLLCPALHTLAASGGEGGKSLGALGYPTCKSKAE